MVTLFRQKTPDAPDQGDALDAEDDDDDAAAPEEPVVTDDDADTEQFELDMAREADDDLTIDQIIAGLDAKWLLDADEAQVARSSVTKVCIVFSAVV